LKVAYIDTSYLVAIAFEEQDSHRLVQRVHSMDAVYSSILLEAEFLAAAEREGLRAEASPLLEGICWAHPDRRLTKEIDEILSHGYLRGADLHHLATARYLFPDPGPVEFLTVDRRQMEIARALGFRSSP